MFSDEHFMQRALDLAQNGLGTTSPNPLVGCVIVHDGRIIGEGRHAKAGQPHAEVLAIDNVKEQALLSQSTAYVTLEPCAHFGKTPPCADLLVKHNLKRVVIAAVDSNPQVGGKGIEKLKSAGIAVKIGVLESAARFQNRRFFTFIEKKRPYIILKWAQTADGFIARENFDSKWISNAQSRQLVHKWRSEEDAILVGKNTVLHDNPQLTTRDWTGKNPLRIVLDHQLVLPDSRAVFDQKIPTLVYNLVKSEERDNLQFVKLSEEKFIEQLLVDLHQRKVLSLIIEGGTQTLQSFIDLGLWDEARVFESSITFEKGIKAAVLKNHLELKSENYGGDCLRHFKKE